MTGRKAPSPAAVHPSAISYFRHAHERQSPFAVVRFPGQESPEAAARQLVSRSILASAIYELWGSGTDYPTLHESVKDHSRPLWKIHGDASFRFEMDSFQGTHSMDEQREIIESFAYTAFRGPVRMKNPDNQFVVFEEYVLDAKIPHKLYLGRLVAESGRKAINKYTLKKRSYIATTSMDAELSLVTANLALAAPGSLAYDPFMGTGSFPLACAHFGACVFGSDLDGRSIRGKQKRNVEGNFTQYGTSSSYLGGFVADLTNTPLRSFTKSRFLDVIICDPPYGVREGLKVLGSTKVALKEVVLLQDGTPAHLSSTYVPPKRPYSFTRMLDDILRFGSEKLVDNGRLCMWMPVAGVTVEDDGEPEEFAVPQHPALEVKSECTQHFNKWSRRLVTYRRRKDEEVDQELLIAYQVKMLAVNEGGLEGLTGTASSMNEFRRKVRMKIYTSGNLTRADEQNSTSKASWIRRCHESRRTCYTLFHLDLGAVIV